MQRRRLRPLDHTIFCILKALENGELHGYAILEALPHIAERKLRFFGPFDLYRTLQTMLNRGWIEEAGDRQDASYEPVTRRHFRLTDAGRAEMWKEARRRENALNANFTIGIIKP